MTQLKKEESGSAKAIFINAKDNTISYILLENSDIVFSPDSLDEDKINKYIYGEIGYKGSLSDFNEIGFLQSNTAIYVDCIGYKINQGDWGFFIHANLSRPDYDHFFYRYSEDIGIREYDGTYDTFIDPNPNSFGGYRFIGNAVIITNDFTLEQLSQMVKSFYMKKIDDPDAVLPRYDLVEHSSHPKIVGMVGDGKDSEEGN